MSSNIKYDGFKYKPAYNVPFISKVEDYLVIPTDSILFKMSMAS